MGLVRQASRGQGKQKRHACSGCGSKSHRLETCRAFAANKLRALLKKVASLKEASKTAVRKELKFRNSPHSSGSFKKNATAKYKAKKLQEVVRSPSAAEVRRRKPSVMPTDTCSTHEEAASWLLQNKFMRKPRRCPGCKGSKLSALKWTRNSMHWRCLKTGCGNRIPWNANSIFQGLRCLPLVLLRMLCVYAQLDLCSVPRAADVVQHARVGRCKASHFLSALRRAEADATSELSQNAALCGNLEAAHAQSCQSTRP